MHRSDYGFLLFLAVMVMCIYFPVFYSDYLYTDEAVQVWLSRKGLNYQTSVPQGRYISYLLFEWFFRFIHTIHDVVYARLFSLLGWLLCLPIWYWIINTVIANNSLPKVLVQLFMVYLVCMPPFTIYVAWAACMEMFIGCTAALAAGYILYSGIRFTDKKTAVPLVNIFGAVAFGLLALFTYQNCFGCFFIPFIIHLAASKKMSRVIFIGIVFSLATFIIYFLLFKYSIKNSAVEVSSRSSLANNPVDKLLFFFAKPLQSAFHFTIILKDKSVAGFVFYVLVVGLWLLNFFLAEKTKPLKLVLTYFAGLFILLVLIYLPSLIVKENYASNRTLFALDAAVFFLVAITVFTSLKTPSYQLFTGAVVAIFFIANAWYNYRFQFLQPLTCEFNLVKKVVVKNYRPAITIVNVVCADENSFENKYHINACWDEFGQPSTSKPWAPSPMIKQLVFELTGNRTTAENLIINTLLHSATHIKSIAADTAKNVLLIDMQQLLNSK